LSQRPTSSWHYIVIKDKNIICYKVLFRIDKNILKTLDVYLTYITQTLTYCIFLRPRIYEKNVIKCIDNFFSNLANSQTKEQAEATKGKLFR